MQQFKEQYIKQKKDLSRKKYYKILLVDGRIVAKLQYALIRR